MKFILKSLTVLFLLAAIAAGGAAYYAWEWLNTPMFSGDEEVIALEVKRGQSVRDVGRSLARQPWFAHPRVWAAYSQHQQLASKIQAGSYQIHSSLTPIETLEKLVLGQVEYQQLTVIEGSTYAQLLAALQANEFIVKTADGDAIDELPLALGLEEGAVLEGWFYPDTMLFAPGISDIELLRKGHRKMQSVLAEEWANRDDGLPYESAYEALIMASIVEKETGQAAERQEIAGVFVRRLNKGMRLQTDPTVIYGLGTNYDGNLRRKDLRADTPYNTYTRHGLPPSPIALPGRDAIHAALHPASGDALFFVAKGDGSHQFSATLKEHESAVREYQINKRRKNYRSSPQ